MRKQSTDTCPHVRQYWRRTKLPCAVPGCVGEVEVSRGAEQIVFYEDAFWETIIWTFIRSQWDGFWSWALRPVSR